MHIDIQKYLDEALKRYTSKEQLEELLSAKDIFFKLTGKLNEDDDDYESRMNSFYDWYLFDYLPKYRVMTLFHEFLKEQGISPELKESFMNINRSYFEYLGMKKDRIILKDILHNKKINLSATHPGLGMMAGDIFVGRSLEYLKEHYLLSGICLLPKEVKPILKKKSKLIRRSKEINLESEFLLKLEQLKTTGTRYKHLSVEEIFTF